MGALLRHSPLLVAALLASPPNPCAAAGPMLGAGDRHSIVLHTDGTVHTWGYDNVGQLGTRALYSTVAKPVVDLGSVTQVAAGRLHGLARLNDGTVRAWGYNSTGALGDGTFADRVRPVQPAITNVAEVYGGGHQSMARKNDGTLWAWGDNTTGQLGDGTNTARTSPVAVLGLSSVATVAMGFSHTLAVKTDGTLWTWGSNARGQLGTGPGPDRSTPMQVTSLSGVIAVAAGVTGNMSVALKSDGTVWTWGSDELGGLGDGGVIPGADRNVPALVAGLTNVIAIGSGRFHVVALKNDGSVWAWGENFTGQLGDGTTTPRSTPAQVTGLTGVVSIAVGRGHNLAKLSNGTVVAWGWNNFGQIGDGTTTDRKTFVPVSQVGVVSQMAAGDGQSYALRADGRVLAWGSDLQGMQGDGGPLTRTVPRQVPSISNVATVSAGQAINIVMKNDFTVWAWGSGVEGALGDGTFTARATAAPVINLPLVAQAIAGGQHALARTAAGVVYAWGTNNSGQIGDGTSSTRTQPVVVNGVTAKWIGAGYRHSTVVATDGSVWTWGLNANGQLGDNTLVNKNVPTLVTGLSGVFNVATGGVAHTLALRSDGKVWAWGSNTYGELGDGTVVQRPAPVQVPGLTSVIAISAGDHRSMALKSDGTVWVWGQNMLGDGTASNSSTPKQVPNIDTAVGIASGYFHMSVLLADGSVRTWGDNTFGAVGDGTYVVRKSPIVVSADDGGGSLDANNWFLDLAPAVATTIPAALTPTSLAVAQASGEDDQLSLDATVKYKAADLGKSLNTYVVALVPAEFFGLVKNAPGAKSVSELKALAKAGVILAQLTPQGWTDVNGQLIAYAQGVANAAGNSASILDRVNTTLIPGSTFCIGYGANADAMLSAQGLREVLTLEGASATNSGVPCVLSGVYVSGPPGSTSGSSVTFTATVVGLSPTGSVSFRDGFATLASAVAISPANPAVSKAAVATSSLIVGTHSISASYSGDLQNVAASTAIPVLHEVRSAQAGARVDISGPASSTAGSMAVFSAVVIGNQATGTVQFLDGATLLAAVPVVEGGATLRIATLAAGNHSIVASYLGDANNSPATSPSVAHLVVANTIVTKVTLAPSTASPKVGTPVTFTATVTGSAPTGSARFRDYGSDFSGAVALANGQAQFTIASLAAGSHAVTATYSGDGSNPPVTSGTVVLDVILELDPAEANADTDGDGIPNGVELAENTNPSIRDNDVFANARLFAMQQYRDFLGREGDAGGINFWASQIAVGTSRDAVIENFFSSAEFQGTIAPVARLYFAYFLRVPEYDGINFWIGYYRAGHSLNEISDFFSQSPEFTSRYGTLDNGQFVNLVYQNVLGRAPDAPGLAFWKGQLDTGGMTRGQVMLGFSESPEYRDTSDSNVYVTMMYIGMLRRAPEPGGFSFWVQYRDAGNSGLALIDGFLSSAEYHARFLP